MTGMHKIKFVRQRLVSSAITILNRNNFSSFGDEAYERKINYRG
jgi:hypothetical protein